jgi:Transposase DDE domain group 1
MNACHPKAYTIPGCDSMQADLASQRHPTPLLLAPVGGKTVALDCDGGRLSSDAGLVLLKDIDEQLGLTRALAAALSDSRDARRIRFTPDDLLNQRLFQSAAGYEDANDANTLRHEPIFQLLLDRLPETGAPLASQPTISRFENRISRTELYRMALVLMDQFIASYDPPPRSSCSMSMTLRTAPMVNRNISATMAIMAGIVSCHATFMKVSRGG